MRQADRDEVSALSGRTPARALLNSVKRSSVAETVLIDGRAEMIFGVGDVNILAGVGSPWALGTDEIERNQREFLRKSVACRDRMRARYPVLCNVVDARNRVSVRWLKWLGFVFSEPVLVSGHVCYVFSMRSGDV